MGEAYVLLDENDRCPALGDRGDRLVDLLYDLWRQSKADLVAEKHPALEAVGHHLGVTIGSLINIFGPERVVIGGGFGVAAFDLLLPAARLAVLTEALAPAGQQVEIELASLGADAGLIGAGLLAFEALR